MRALFRQPAMVEHVPLTALASGAPSTRVMGFDRLGSAVSHAHFQQRVAAWHAAFAAQPGHDWALYHDDALEFAAALYGAWYAGKDVYLPGDIQPGTQASLSNLVDGFAGNIPGRADVLAPVANAATVAFPHLDAQVARLFVFTSGSTGTPKSIVKTLAQLMREVETLEASWGERLGDARVYATVSHQHFYGLIFGFFWPLSAGRPMGTQRLLYPENMIVALSGGPSVLISSPAHLKRLPEESDWSSVQGHVRVVFSAGGKLSPDAVDTTKTCLHCMPVEIYGSSETGCVLWKDQGRAPASWSECPGVTWRIVDGVLHIRSAFLPNDDWWPTEDRADSRNGELELLGRADRIVKIEEQRVSLTELEQVLCSHALVREARVVALPGKRTSLAAVIVPTADGFAHLRTDGRRALSQMLKTYLAGFQATNIRPRAWRFVEALPSNAQGKTPDALLRGLFAPERPEAEWRLREDYQAEIELHVTPDLAVFNGHFPEIPILPGVAQLDWAVHFARRAFAVPPQFCGVQVLKFQKVTQPDTRLLLTLTYKQDTGRVEFLYTSAQGTHASGRILFGQASDDRA